MLDAKLIETSIFNVNGDSLLGLLIIGTFEKRAPGHINGWTFLGGCLHGGRKILVPGRPGGGGTPLQEANGDVPLDGVAFSQLE